MKLPKSITTVTRFSKFLALILFISLPLGGFYIGMQYQKNLALQSIAPILPSVPTPVPTRQVPQPTSSKIESIFCGGIAGIKCPTGFSCQMKSRNPDASGECINSNEIPPKSWDESACTQDAKICPDGSSVGRQGPNCEFASCPN